MTAPKPLLKRCAIYTRKSNEEGLEQEFNSLHAQRESCEAYIVSQKHEGWKIVNTPYDDGGFSGGNINRPALKQLLDDITAGKIDVIVVYKVDRLSRSLHDFARMVEVFDKHHVSFVSVTQQFNTSTPMGRLTLNVLLSFAQFEREVTGERIRDKIAASKKKGMWMGGFVPLGYDAVDKKLVINPQEAETVRQLFRRYLALRCVRLLKEELDRDGMTTKTRTKEDGTITGGCFFSRGSLYKILSNPIYIGQIRHKAICHPGQHEPIIDQSLWDAVQQQLKNNAPQRLATRKTDTSLLAGKLFDASGDRLAPSHANKRGRRYRYYVSYSLKTGAAEQNRQGWRLPAQEIEETVIRAARSILNDRLAISAALRESNIAVHHIPAVLSAADALSKKPDNGDAIVNLIERVDLRMDGICLRLSLASLVPVGASTSSDTITTTRDVPMRMKRRGVEMRLVIEGGTTSKTDPILIKTIARAHGWFEELQSGQIKNLTEIASREGIDNASLSRIIPLAFLAPGIIESIIAGSQPADLTAQRLLKYMDLPIDWAEQKRLFGIV